MAAGLSCAESHQEDLLSPFFSLFVTSAIKTWHSEGLAVLGHSCHYLSVSAGAVRLGVSHMASSWQWGNGSSHLPSLEKDLKLDGSFAVGEEQCGVLYIAHSMA